MLKLFSKKLVPVKIAPRVKRNQPHVGWIQSTVDYDGQITPKWSKMLASLHKLNDPQLQPEILNLFKSFEDKNIPEIGTGFTHLCALTSQVRSPPPITTWKQLQESHQKKGLLQLIPKLFRLRSSNDALDQILKPSNQGLNVYVMASLLNKLAGTKNKQDLETAIAVLNKPWSPNARTLGLTALIHGNGTDWPNLIHILRSTSVPPNFKLQKSTEIQLRLMKDTKKCADIVECLALNNVDLSSICMEIVLRRLLNANEYTARKVMLVCAKTSLPKTIYPLLVRMLSLRRSKQVHSDKLTNIAEIPEGATNEQAVISPDGDNDVKYGSAETKSKQSSEIKNLQDASDLPCQEVLNSLFEVLLSKYAVKDTTFVLNLLAMSTIITDGVQSVHSILAKWSSYDIKGVSEETWLLVFREFRRLGQPTKCSEILREVLQKFPKLQLPFVYEYLVAVSQFDNVHMYMHALNSILPELQEVLQSLGISEHVSQLPQPDRGSEFTVHRLVRSNLTAPVTHVRESLLVITYRSVLPTVECKATLAKLFEKYLMYAQYSRKPSHVYVTDLFVEHMLALSDRDPTDAVDLYLQAIQTLRLRPSTTGRSSSISVKRLVNALVKKGDLEKALQLVISVDKVPALNIDSAVVKPILESLKSDKDLFADWCRQKGMLVEIADKAAVELPIE